nr:hypothetical protein [uncultured Desulfobacter sp.]
MKNEKRTFLKSEIQVKRNIKREIYNLFHFNERTARKIRDEIDRKKEFIHFLTVLARIIEENKSDIEGKERLLDMVYGKIYGLHIS